MSSFSSLGFTCWLTGSSCSGKSTIATEIVRALDNLPIHYELLDSDIIRTNLSNGLGVSREDRNLKVLRVGFVCRLLKNHGVNVVVAMTSPYQETREKLRLYLPNFIEVYLDTPLEVCIKRLYKKAFSNEIPEFTEISSPYEPPEKPDLTLRTHEETIEQCVEKVLEYLYSRCFILKC
jgi:adenylylsulfate kinase